MHVISLFILSDNAHIRGVNFAQDRTTELMRALLHVLIAMASLSMCPPSAMGQLVVPGPIVLDGPEAVDRQVNGLGTATDPDEALSVGSVRALEASSGSATLSGTVWEVSIGNGGAPPVVGMVLTIVPDTPNPASIALNVNGSGPYAVLGWRGDELDSACFLTGIPIRLVFTGEHYLVLDEIRSTCPTGYLTYAIGTCIEQLPRSALNFFDASSDCLATGGRLCTFAEWTAACTMIAGFMDTVDQIEWIDHASNSANYAKIIGIGDDGVSGSGTGCNYGGLRLPTTNAKYRCCIER